MFEYSIISSNSNRETAMRGVNKVMIIGHLGAEPDVHQFANGNLSYAEETVEVNLVN